MKKKRIYIIISLIIISGILTTQEFSITIDGKKDSWYNQLSDTTNGLIFLPARAYFPDINPVGPDNDKDISALVWMGWDSTYFYLYEEVIDDTICVNNSNYQCYHNDGIVVRFDPDPTVKAESGVHNIVMTAYGEDKAPLPEYVTNLGEFYDQEGNIWIPTTEDYARNETAGGYILEFRIPWEYSCYNDRSVSVGVGNIFGIAVGQTDNDEFFRENIIAWSAGHTDNTWRYPDLLGTATFMPDHILKFSAVNSIDTSVINDSASVWYSPDEYLKCDFLVDTTFGINPLTVHFSNYSFGEIVLYQWDFNNDGITDSNEKDPVYTYTNPGTYSVKLAISTGIKYDTLVAKNYIQVIYDPNQSQIENNEMGKNNFPEKYILYQNFPNPFNPITKISFNLLQKTDLNISIYNITGQKVYDLFTGTKQSGTHYISWDATGYPSGVYFIKMQIKDFYDVKKCLLVK
jgi:PKD repeat protein